MGFSSVTVALEAAVVFSPAVALAITALVWWRIRRDKPAVRVRVLLDSTADVLVPCALLLVSVLTLVNPGSGGGVVLVPFTGMLSTGMSMTTLYQSGGNIALFVPLGALLPLAYGRWLARWYRVLAVSAALSAVVELTQYLLATGHVSSVDDVVLNAAGGLLGAGLTWWWWRVGPRTGSAGPAVVAGYTADQG
ncbi:VanZ family protein [Haloactinospora alba]|nr:VanZ family protein [Haloactinospora alba]